jgi:hypothetical protein
MIAPLKLLGSTSRENSVQLGDRGRGGGWDRNGPKMGSVLVVVNLVLVIIVVDNYLFKC